MENKKIYNLADRTEKFSIRIIDFVTKIPKTIITNNLISQLVRSGTSIGANYCEADNAESSKDFKHKIGICKKEARETRYWFNMVAKAVPSLKDQAFILSEEARELNLIFNAINKKLENKGKH